ncbi:MAG: glycerate kinase type-2 family protein [Maritimibacter sp.]
MNAKRSTENAGAPPIPPAHRARLTALFDAAVAAADPLKALKHALPPRPKGRTIVIGAGKGAAQLAAAFETLWDAPLTGVVVTRYGYGCATRTIKVLEAAHPVPDAAGLAATKAMFEAVEGLSADDLVVALVCGGGSALLPAPPDGFSLQDEQKLNEALLASGAPIAAMNMIRKQFSQIKGGRLAQAAHPAKVVNLIVSDVPGDDPAQVASGPTVPDGKTARDAIAALDAYAIKLPQDLRDAIAKDTAPVPTASEFALLTTKVVASAGLSLEAAARVCDSPAVILSDAIEGEARDVALVHAAITREVITKSRPFTAPVAILSGGETTVTLRGKGKGGRNTEFLLALAIALDGQGGWSALAADTDGIDGSEENAGAFADGTSAARMRQAGVDPAAALARNDAYTAFASIGDIFAPGPTGTNVNDLRAILID